MAMFQYYQLSQIIEFFLSQGKEGECWDFKQEWHDDIADLLKDIVCFANTVHDEKCYLIFGVSNDLELKGMETTRRKQADIIDAISHLHFAGDVYPHISVETIKYKGVDLDVLIIENCEQTPIYLKRSYGAMMQNSIYMRIGDKNTPDKGCADISDIEQLWKKRLGLTKTPLEFIYDRMKNRLEWKDNGDALYNIYRPEYTIEIEYDDEDPNWHEYYSYAMTNERSCHGILRIKCHGTTLESYEIAELDSAAVRIPVPEWGYLCHDEYGMNFEYCYKYYIAGTRLSQVLSFMYDRNNGEASYAMRRLYRVVLVYESNEERLAFESWIEANQESVKSAVAASTEYDYIDTGDATMTAEYQKRLRAGLVLNGLLADYRSTRKTTE